MTQPRPEWVLDQLSQHYFNGISAKQTGAHVRPRERGPEREEKALNGLRPPFSAQLPWAEHGAPVREPSLVVAREFGRRKA